MLARSEGREMKKVVNIHSRIDELEKEVGRLQFTILEVIRMIHFDHGRILKDTWWHPSGGTMMDVLVQSLNMSQEEVISEITNFGHVKRMMKKGSKKK
jgi:hypothetical protein